MKRFFSRISLHRRFVLVLAVGAILPLGLLGGWLAHSTERSGEELLRARLQRGLLDLVEELGRNWVSLRSDLMDVAELPEVRRSLVAARNGETLESAVGGVIVPAPASLHPNVHRILVRDASGEVRLALGGPSGSGSARPEPLVPVSLGIFDRSGQRLGTLDADLRLGSLLSLGPGRVSVAGSVVALFDPATGASLLPLRVDETLVRQPRFAWAAETWIGERRQLTEPSLELVLAAPVDPFRRPFVQATRRGTVILIAVAALSLLLVTLVTARLTRSLGDLAAGADAVARGALETTVPSSGGAEIERLAEAFNSMTARLRTSLEQLARARSLAAVGEFAASLAHEVRNPLSAIRLDLQRAEERMAPSRERELVARALGSIERLESTVTGALRVARSGEVVLAPLDLRVPLLGAIRGAMPELERCSVELDFELEAETGNRTAAIEVVGDPAALEQVFLNLLLNAAQAQEGGGRAGVRLVEEDRRVAVEVWDNGPGIPAAVRERVFEPFFSTREKGTGLGLAVAQQVVAAHAGELQLDAAPDHGTVARVRLPLAIDTTKRP